MPMKPDAADGQTPSVPLPMPLKPDAVDDQAPASHLQAQMKPDAADHDASTSHAHPPHTQMMPEPVHQHYTPPNHLLPMQPMPNAADYYTPPSAPQAQVMPDASHYASSDYSQSQQLQMSPEPVHHHYSPPSDNTQAQLMPDNVQQYRPTNQYQPQLAHEAIEPPKHNEKFGGAKSMNFSFYGQWMGILSIILLIVLGIVGFLEHVVFSVVGWVIAIILVFVEVPLTLRVLPRTRAVNSMLLFYEHCILRSIMYLVFSVVMFLSNILNGPTPLIAPAVALILTCLCYLAAGMLGQPFASSRVLGGTMDRIV